MHIVLAALFAFAILTLWVPAYWPVAVFEAGIYALAAVMLVRSRQSFRFSFPLIPLSAAVLWGIFQWLSGQTLYVFETKLAILRWGAFWCAFVLSLDLFRKEKVRGWFLTAMVWFGFVIAVLASAQTFTWDGRIFWMFPTEYSNVMGPILYHNHYAVFIEIVFPIAMYNAILGHSKRLLYSAIAATMYASVIVSASRAGTVLVTAEIVAVVAALRWQHRISRRTAGIVFLEIVLLFGAFTAVVGWENLWHRFRDNDPMEIRRELAISSLAMAKEHPWFGVGLGNWPAAYPRYAVIDTGRVANQAHSDWLQWAAEGGIPFGLLMTSLFLWCWRPAFRSVWGLGVIAVLTHAAFDYPFSRPALGSWTILMMGIVATI